MRRLTVAALAPSLAAIFLAGVAQATDRSPVKRGVDFSPVAAKSGSGLLIAQAGGPAPKSPGEKKSSDEEKKSSGEKKPAAKKQVGNAKTNTLNGTKGPDLMLGGTGNDVFVFNYDLGAPEQNTLDDGERIADYEFGERIVIRGVRLPNVKLVYDAKKKETRIEIDLPHKNDKGETDGRVRRTVILTGDKRGTLNADIPCCISKATEIWIHNEKAAKAARAARIKATKEAKKKARKKAAKKEPVKPRSAAADRLDDPTRAPAEVSEAYVRNFFGLALFANLFGEPPAAAEERQLREVAARHSEAQVALSEGPGGTGSAKLSFEIARARLGVLANPKFTRSSRVRRLARSYLSRLPKRFVSGHAYTRDDGTAAADPDPRVRFQLERGRYSKDAGDGGGGGDAD